MVKSPMGYEVGQRLMATWLGRVLQVTQVYEGDAGVWQIVLSDPRTGHDVCRASEAEVRAACYELER